MAKARTPRNPIPANKQVISAPENGTVPINSVPVKKSAGTSTSAPASFINSDPETKIRQRAYELYERRGYTPGFDQEDWFEAERQILGRSAKQSA